MIQLGCGDDLKFRNAIYLVLMYISVVINYG